MSTPQLVVACDFGTTSFRALICEVTGDGSLRVLGAGQVPAVGFQDGDFVDLGSGSRCIAKAVRTVEAAADVDISAFYYNISGSHLRSVWARGQVLIGPGPRAIKESDLESALAKARSLVIPFDNWILAVNPVEYAVDRVRGIVNPLGRIGSQLEVEAHLITGSRSVVRNIEHAINTAGYEVAGRAVDVLAAATALLTPAEQDDGVLLIDVGGRLTNWALFRDDRIVGNGLVPCGGAHLTGDLSHGLRTSQEEAEQIKRMRGVVLRSLVGEASPDVLFDEGSPAETPGLVAAILEPRLEEIFSLVKEGVGDARQIGALGHGIVLTGGGSRCEGSGRLCEEVFGAPVKRRYLPDRLIGAEKLGEGHWATAVGLGIWAAGAPLPESATAGDGRSPTGPFWRKVRHWVGRSRGREEGPGLQE